MMEARPNFSPGQRIRHLDQPPDGLGEPTYANNATVQRQRLQALEALLDEGTTRVLEHRGVSQGWRCLELGAGGGSIASWLCTRVAPGGSVVGTDLDTTSLEELEHPNLESRVHDVAKDELPEGDFDFSTSGWCWPGWPAPEPITGDCTSMDEASSSSACTSGYRPATSRDPNCQRTSHLVDRIKGHDRHPRVEHQEADLVKRESREGLRAVSGGLRPISFTHSGGLRTPRR